MLKTAISIPDDLFEEAERARENLGMSRSELYSTAVRQFLTDRRATGVTERLNEVYTTEDSSLDPVLLRLALQSLPDDEW